VSKSSAASYGLLSAGIAEGAVASHLLKSLKSQIALPHLQQLPPLFSVHNFPKCSVNGLRGLTCVKGTLRFCQQIDIEIQRCMAPGSQSLYPPSSYAYASPITCL